MDLLVKEAPWSFAFDEREVRLELLRGRLINRSRRRKEADSWVRPFYPPPYVGGYSACETCGLESPGRIEPRHLGCYEGSRIFSAP